MDECMDPVYGAYMKTQVREKLVFRWSSSSKVVQYQLLDKMVLTVLRSGSRSPLTQLCLE